MKRREFVNVLLVAILGVGVAVAAQFWLIPEWWRFYYYDIRQDMFEELQPVALQNCVLKRVGSANDGGYLMCENLMAGLQTAYSYGVGANDDWGCDVSRNFHVPVHQYDCFDPARPTCEGGNFFFHNECISDRAETVGGRVFDTLSNQIRKNGEAGRRMVVKIDVEGAEWDALLGTPDEVLARIDQMPMELHGVNDRRFLEAIQKLKRTFYVVNLHFNNRVCSRYTEPLSSYAYQVLLVNKRIGVLDELAQRPARLSPLNAPDFPGLADCQPDFSVR
jgi:hypothetical protein